MVKSTEIKSIFGGIVAEIKSFNGVRYAQSEISKLICPPYDIISAKEKTKLQKNSPYNMVRLELSDPSGTKNKYANAAMLFNNWQADGALITDNKPSFYIYEQTFKDDGKTHKRCGFFAALKAQDPQKGEVKPHEKTLSKPKADRLKLLRAVKANLSPIFGLFNDKNKTFNKVVKAVTSGKPVSVCVDKDGTKQKLWQLSDKASCKSLEQLLKNQNIFIADGHHRYETAWNYACERAKKDKNSKTAEYNFVMAYVCPMEDTGLVVWPTHRVFTKPVNFDSRVAEYFKVLSASAYAKLSKTSGLQPLMVYENAKAKTLVLKDEKLLARFMPDKCKAYRNLAVSVLHSILIPELVPEKITFVKNGKEAIALAKKQKNIAVLVPATPVIAIKKIALAGQTMPQKSTYFYPKVSTGIVIHKV